MWQADFYQQYMQQHTAMTNWIMQLHQNIQCQISNVDYGAYNSEFQDPEHTYYEHSYPVGYTSFDNPTSASFRSCPRGEIEEQGNYEESEDDDESCEYEFNVEAILAMRAAKEELLSSSNEGNKSSVVECTTPVEESSESDSFVLVDSDKEEYEYVELGSIKTLESKRSRTLGSHRNMKEEMQNEKTIMNYIYGEKAPTIAGLETAMSINFDRLCDILQPPLWPVLPVRL